MKPPVPSKDVIGTEITQTLNVLNSDASPQRPSAVSSHTTRADKQGGWLLHYFRLSTLTA
jgi:hypothetical protein